MKKIFTSLVFAAALFATLPSQAQIKFGLKGGYNITDMSISSDVVKKSNQTGFFVGPTAKFTLPLVGLGIDAAALYDQREAKWGEGDEASTISEKSINIPINLRYSIGLGSLASLYLAAGPQFGFNIGGKNYNWGDEANYELEKSNVSINVGAGVMLIDHLEIGCTYNIACGKTGELTLKDAAESASNQVVSKNNRTNAWQIYAAYYF